MPSEYAKSLGARLRSIRQQQGLSLQGVEEKSGGRWKAVVVGSYERGDRAVTVVPPCRAGRLLPGPRRGAAARWQWRPARAHQQDRPGPGAAVRRTPPRTCAYVARYARAIQQQRGDYNGRVLSIRADDLRALAIVYDASPSGLVERLTEHGVLVADPRALFAC